MSSGNPEQERAREKRAANAWAISPGLPWEFAAQFAASEVALAVAAERLDMLENLAIALKPYPEARKLIEKITAAIHERGRR